MFRRTRWLRQIGQTLLAWWIRNGVHRFTSDFKLPQIVLFTTPTWNLDRSIIINCSVEFFLTIAERVRGSKKLVRLKEPGKEGFANKSDRVEWIRDSDYKHNLINRYYIPNFMSADWRKGATYIQSRCNFRISSQHRSTSAR